MSHKGTLPVFSARSAFENCLQAVRDCDLFLGIITPSYGSGQDPTDDSSLSITHQEIKLAIELGKPRWLLAHENVIFARSFLNKLSIKGGIDFRGTDGRANLNLKKSPIFEDLRVIDLYEEAIIHLSPPIEVPLSERKGNWVQKYHSNDDGATFVSAQFFRYQEVEKFIEENFKKDEVLQNSGGTS